MDKDFAQLIQQVAGIINSQEKLMLPKLANKAHNAAKQFSNDYGLIGIANILQKMAANNALISKADFSKLVDQYYSPSSKVKKVFAEEVGESALAKPQILQHTENEGENFDIYTQAGEKGPDPILANALEGMFEKEHRIYSKEDGKKAVRSCTAQLMAAGFEPKSVNVFAGQEDIIVCIAEYDTPKGLTSIIIPVIISEGKALLPELLLTSDGFQDITQASVSEHIAQTAGKHITVNANALLEVLNTVIHPSKKVSEVDVAMASMAAEKNHKLDSAHCLFGKIDEKIKPCRSPKIAGVNEFEQKLQKPEGIAGFVHGEKLVEAGRSVIMRKMAEFGYRQTQIKVSSANDQSITYSVGIGASTGFAVPVSIENKRIQEPLMIVANGSLSDFTRAAIDGLIKENRSDGRAFAMASSCSDMKPTDLIKTINASIAEGNFLRAEEALNVLGAISPENYKVGLANYISATNKISSGSAPEANIQKIASKKMNDIPRTISYELFYPSEENK